MSRVLVFCDPDFPVPEGRTEALRTLAAALGSGGADREDPLLSVTDAAGLAGALEREEFGCFIHLHGPYFPKAAWPALLAHLRRGGGMIAAGGAPFKHPVKREDGAWRAEAEQTAYHQQLHVHEALRVEGAGVERLRVSEQIPLLEGDELLFEAGPAWNLVPHVTRNSDLPHQMGSAGPMDTRITALLTGVNRDGRETAAPVVLWENTGGPYCGSRWIWINQPLTDRFAGNGGAAALRRWAAFCARGVTELWLKPNYASYAEGERAVLTLQTQRLGRAGRPAGGEAESWTFRVSVCRENAPPEESPWICEVKADVTLELDLLRIPVPVPIRPGSLYRVAAEARQPASGERRLLRQGFWGYDEGLLAEGAPVVCGRDYFEKDGRPLPVVGMTYMASDVARKFLFLPNADVWDRDMAHMARAGINWIRTGIWTAYRNIMQVDGHASEEVLRAVDAFLMTAKKHGLQVTFTFFSFTPEAWEGTNPYLDPRSIAAQKRFIRSVVSRYRQVTGVDWDLINEPSLFDPARIFAAGPRSCRDIHERQAFAEWLRQRHGTVEALQEQWNMTPDELPDFTSVVPPEPEDINFDVQDMHRAKKGTRWLDYVLFSMEVHNRWAAELKGTIKELCGAHLVTVGQDEALGAQRPSPFFYAEAVDYTTVHSWWLNDHLVWDGVFAKTPGKPNLIQETGIMYAETPDGRAKRSEAELRGILERKYAYAFATGGAGAVQWIWNTNYYMDNANESHIGALRADGTEKPEAEVSYGFGRFMGEIRELFRDRRLEDIAVVFPYSNDFSNRPLAFDATAQAVRVLAYELKVPFRGIGEYHLDALEADPPKLIIVPSAHNFADEAVERLLKLAGTAGATLLFTGPCGIGTYWRKSGRLDALVGVRELANVRREETLRICAREYSVSFGGRRIAEVFKETPEGREGEGDLNEVAVIPYGSGRLIWCPLPVELNGRVEPVAALYRFACGTSGCAGGLEWLRGGELPGVYGRKLPFAAGSLYIFVSESGSDAEVAVKDTDTGRTYKFMLERERSVLFAANSAGILLAVYRPDDVRVEWF